MSLINQMLKDLDKRRRQGEPSADKGIPDGVQQLQQPVGVKVRRSFFSLPTYSHWRLPLLLIVGVTIGMLGWNYWQQLSISNSKESSQPTVAKHSISSEIHHVLSELKHHLKIRLRKSSSANKDKNQYAHLDKLLTDVQQTSAKNTAALHQLADQITQQQPRMSSTASLNLMSAQAIPEGVQLTLDLSTNPMYKIIENPEQNQLTIELMQTQLHQQYQAIKSLLPPIADINTSKRGDDLIISIQLESGTHVSDMLLDKPTGMQLLFAFTHVNLKNDDISWTTNRSQSVKNGVFKKESALTSAEMANRYYARALSMADRHDIAGASTLLEKILKQVPEFHDARETLAAIYIKQKRYRQAQRLLSVGLSIHPELPTFLDLQARTLTAQGKRKQAIALLQKHSPSIRKYPNYYAFLAALYQQNGDYLFSAKLYDELVKIQPNNGLWWLGMAIGLNATEQRGAALHAYKQAELSSNLTPQLRAYVDEQITKLQ